MGKIFIIIGKSATGKDTIYQRIVDEYKNELSEIVMYTTRPIRSGEENGREYYFVNEERFQALKQENRIIESREYHTELGLWRYFTVKDNQFQDENSNFIMLGTIESFTKLRNYFGKSRVIPIYIEVESGERLERALKRERKQEQPKYAEMCRRFLADEQDFSEEKLKEAGIDKRYENIEIEDCISAIIKNIKSSIDD